VEEVELLLEVGGEVAKLGPGDDLADSVPQCHGPHPVAVERSGLLLKVGDKFMPGQGITLRFLQTDISGSLIYIICDILQL